MVDKKKEHYIDNVKFSQAATEYAELYEKNLQAGLPPPQLSNYCGECIILLAHKISNMNCFNQYTFKDEMVQDGIEVCLKYFHKFDAEKISERTGKKSAGAHAYFTMFIYNAMINRINIEKTQMFLKQKYIANSEDIFVELQEQDTENFNGELKDILREMSGDDYIEYDKKLQLKHDEYKANNLKNILVLEAVEEFDDMLDLIDK